MKPKFVNDVAMKVTKEQFEKDLKQPLIKLGYKDDTCSGFTIFPYLRVFPDGNIGNYTKPDCTEIKIKDYNPELFLAYAAMTEGKDWIVGEWLFHDNEECFFKVKELTGADSIRGFASNDCKHLYRKATREEIENHFAKQYKPNKANVGNYESRIKRNRFPFKLDISNAKKIIKAACNDWKKDLSDSWGYILLVEDSVEITEDFYSKMRKACTPEQHELFDEIFGKDVNYIPDGTPCLVRDLGHQSWLLRYANGKGEFYSGKTRQSRPWVQVHVIKELGDLPQ